MTFTWTIIHIFPKTVVKSKDGERERPKQNFVVEADTNSEYPDVAVFDVFGNRNENLYEILGKLKKGDMVDVDFNINTRLPEKITNDTRLFTNLNARRIRKKQTDLPDNDDNDNLPF